ncbi:glutaredoxin family protein [Methanofollis fontis]|uniref:Glutaredoxin family protein n=1 Tax=Methanofollis fontis TaxID=2052832 RepID=A0A483CLZ2_9EURY|nr:glutaredoxin family protein [Methanofollis fontis]TAJ44009.1 glutaredoxin family protein [Methanofollis fontis]
MELVHVDGQDRGEVVLYALSTCGWCGKTKNLLTSLDVAFDYVYVDLLERDEMEQVYAEMMQRYNPSGSFPTLVINGTVIVGFQEDEIREALA